ncbi:uncharacterized protein DFL_008076 [Arthrobotrys flagrans]|uniref:F-box domain-containing protein n=1 Tax=Arthrobotrys flagrans TaxID=97331 RepID=A0A436ZMS7_ARTFL|nr:hypothetical protein DFL_008076 [Arthrobotrys flagrans]
MQQNRNVQNFQTGSRRDPFQKFPAELNILIIKGLGRNDLYSLSRCSRLCYLLCFPLRFDASTITLTEESIKLFQDGGICEEYRDGIRSVHFSKPWVWEKVAAGNKYYQPAADCGISAEQIITRLRVWTNTLNLFPNTRELYVSYIIPPAVENNIYTAIFSSIATQPFYNALESLEFQIYKDKDIGCPPDSDVHPQYEDTFSELSLENQEFLGTKIANDEIDELIRTKALKLSSLTEARISVNGLRTPLITSKSTSWEGSTFYYIPLTLAPNLQHLQIETMKESEDRTKPSNPNDSLLEIFKKYQENPYPNPNSIHPFHSVTVLQYLNNGTPSKEEIDSLSQIFPDLEVLEISQLEQSKRDTFHLCPEHERDNRYDGVGKLKHLADLTMPWPAYEFAGSIDPADLSGWVYRWIQDEAGRLEVVVFEGTRYVMSPGRRDEIRVTFEVDATKLEVDMKGDTWRLRYGDIDPESD